MYKKFTQLNIDKYINKIECFGISLDNENVIQMKCYKWMHNEDKNFFKYKCHCKLLYDIEKENLGHLFDYTSEIENNEKVYRVTCKIKNNSIYDGIKMLEKFKIYFNKGFCEEFIVFHNFICECQKSEKSPIAEVGMKFIEEGLYSDIKIYYTLRKFNGVNDVLGNVIGVRENIDFFNNAFAFLGVDELKQTKIMAISEILQKDGYFPTLFGINKNSEISIYKIYYELTDYEKRIHGLKINLKKLFEEMSKYISVCVEKIYEIILYYENINFYLRGIAIDLTLKENFLKLYFCCKE